MKKILKPSRLLAGLCLVAGAVHASQNGVLFSIFMPPAFQQPYFQAMVKADNANVIKSLPVNFTVPLQTQEGLTPATVWGTSDYISYYTDFPSDNRYASYETVVYGLTPYVTKGYTEGFASSLYLQRPAQVQLPFTPPGGSPVYATLPDYIDIFLASLDVDTLKNLPCGTPGKPSCNIPSKGTTLSAWSKYIPVSICYSAAGGHCDHLSRNFASSIVMYGKLPDLANRAVAHPVSGMNCANGNGYNTDCSWGTVCGFPCSGFNPAAASNLNILSNSSVLRSLPRPWDDNFDHPVYLSGFNTLPVAPVVPGVSDLQGNFSFANNPYLPTATNSYNGTSLPNGMSYFRIFYENMQWFSMAGNTTYVTPGQGVTSDALQIAAMQAVPASGTVAVFTGSTGNSNITGPIMMTGTAGQTSFSLPQAFCSTVTPTSFLSGIYFQAQRGSTGSQSGWGGALGPQESPLEYYMGVIPRSNAMIPYLPLYLLDPGYDLQKDFPLGSNLCSEKDFQQLQINSSSAQQMWVSRDSLPMTNFHDTLSGTRRR